MFFVPDFPSCMVPLTEEIGAKDSVFLSVDHIACIRSMSITCAILESLYELVIKRQSLVYPRTVRKQGTFTLSLTSIDRCFSVVITRQTSDSVKRVLPSIYRRANTCYQ